VTHQTIDRIAKATIIILGAIALYITVTL